MTQSKPVVILGVVVILGTNTPVIVNVAVVSISSSASSSVIRML